MFLSSPGGNEPNNISKAGRNINLEKEERKKNVVSKNVKRQCQNEGECGILSKEEYRHKV